MADASSPSSRKGERSTKKTPSGKRLGDLPGDRDGQPRFTRSGRTEQGKQGACRRCADVH